MTDQGGSSDAVFNALCTRVRHVRLDLVKAYGLSAVMAELRAYADQFAADSLEEIGSSDVSCWISDIEQTLKRWAADMTRPQERMNTVNTSQSTMLRIRNTHGEYLTPDGEWDSEAGDAWTTSHAPEAATRAMDAQIAAGHAFFAEVETVQPGPALKKGWTL